MMRVILLTSILSGSLVWSATAGTVDFARDIRPILSDKCFFCHGPDEEDRKADLRLDLREDAFADRKGIAAFVPGDLEMSESWYRIITDDEDELMPPPKVHKPLSKNEKDLIKRWIEEGAEWTDHWAFVNPSKPDSVEQGQANPIDDFIAEELEGSGLEMSKEADRRTLIRRITFDLTGLPPTPEEVGAFVKDDSPDAFAKLVDRLLASPHFGERMALMWLDAARYGDTSVMHADGPRDMWPWRDWVVNAFNENQPYDQFSIEQIAGDLLPDPSLNQLIASGFNRNHPSSDEGGAIPEELRVSYVADRVKTTSNVWLGLSMECAQCHDHKYDPISQKEYFQFYAYFNNTTDPGMQTRRGNQLPFVEVLTELEEDKVDAAEERRDVAAEKVKVIANQERKNGAVAGDSEPEAKLKERFANLVHYFPFDDVRSRVQVDAVGGKDLLGPKASKTISDGKFDQGTQVGERYYDSAGVTEIDFKSKFTFATWVRIPNLEKSGAAFARMDVKNGHRGYDFWIQNGKPGIHLINQWPGKAVKVLSEVPLKPGEWQHVAITYNGTSKAAGISIYIDGEPVGKTIHTDKLSGTIKASVPFRVGGRSTGAGVKAHLDELQIYNRVLTRQEIAWTQKDLVSEAHATLADQRESKQRRILMAHHLSQVEAWSVAKTDELHAELEIAKLLSGKTTTMVMEDNAPDEMRMTYVLDRGAYDAPKEDEVISPGTPAALPSLPADAPANRLALANWLFDDEHPLTARVTVNLIWQMFFGEGIVRTPADFGAQGDFPTHPELLDWLAVDFRDSGWDVKRLIRQIVLSETYRQSSHLGPKDHEVDPDNRLLARAPRFRLQAEMLRDNALALSGQLVDVQGGPGVKPYQPPGLWAEVSLGGNPKFVQDKGDKLYRRSLYTYWKRSAPPPAMVIFDAPNRETCVLKRPRTNTPLQALAAMNDVQVVEASRHFAERLMREGGDSAESRASWMFELATARPPESGELAALLEVYESGLSKYEEDTEAGTALLSAGDSARDESLNVSEHAAWTVVASLILNLDEVMTRN
ncbi:MAG: DUF1553 domain-containing protein [Verrucomicrobiota bacterium]